MPTSGAAPPWSDLTEPASRQPGAATSTRRGRRRRRGSAERKGSEVRSYRGLARPRTPRRLLESRDLERPGARRERRARAGPRGLGPRGPPGPCKTPGPWGAGGPAESAELVRGLGTWDAALVTIGSVLGTGIFITTGDIARVLPHPGLILLVGVAGGLVTLAGALTYAELGALFPRAGGQYEFLKEAYGRFFGFLFGWAAFFVIMTGGIAALAVGFGEYLRDFVPFFSTKNVLVSVPIGGRGWGLC